MHSRLSGFLLAAGVVLLDRLSKLVVETHVGAWETIVLVPGCFNLIHTRNPGAAFSLLASAEPGWRSAALLVLSLAAVGLVTVLLWRCPAGARRLRTGLALMWGGAAGNLYDRLWHGEVTDFLELYWGRFHWPAFNVADSAITVGAVLVIWDLWRAKNAPARS